MKRAVRAAAAMLAAAVLLAACARESAPPELLEPVSVRGDMAVAEIGDICDGIIVEGNVFPEIEKLKFAASGKVAEVCVVIGETVKKGDPLIKLDTEALQKKRDSLEERLEYAERENEFAGREAELNRGLLADQFGVWSAYYKLYDNEQNAAAGRREAEIAALREDLEEAENDLNVKNVITSPFDGTVAYLNVKVGDWAVKEEDAATVVNDGSCFMRTKFISQTTLSLAKSIYATVGGERHEVTYVPMDTEDYLTSALSGETMFSTFAIDKPDKSLIGQYALLYLLTSSREQVLNIPANALVRESGGFYVYVDENGKKAKRQVEVGLRTAAQAEIKSGLKEGDSVYVAG